MQKQPLKSKPKTNNSSPVLMFIQNIQETWNQIRQDRYKKGQLRAISRKIKNNKNSFVNISKKSATPEMGSWFYNIYTGIRHFEILVEKLANSELRYMLFVEEYLKEEDRAILEQLQPEKIKQLGESGMPSEAYTYTTRVNEAFMFVAQFENSPSIVSIKVATDIITTTPVAIQCDSMHLPCSNNPAYSYHGWVSSSVKTYIVAGIKGSNDTEFEFDNGNGDRLYIYLAP